MPASTTPSPRGAPRPRRGPSLYTKVLSLAVAAAAATWLPFSVLYINALNHRPPVAATAPLSTPARGSGSSPVTTRASVPAAAAQPGSTATASPTPVSTHAS